MTVYKEPTGPGVRVDSGVRAGDVIGGQFDSMLAKLIVTGENRQQALERSRRALAEFEVEGMATVLPFHRHIVSNPAFIGDENGFEVYTKWIETDWDNPIEPYTGAQPIEEDDTAPRQTVVVEVGADASRCRCPATSLSPAPTAVATQQASSARSRNPAPARRAATPPCPATRSRRRCRARS